MRFETKRSILHLFFPTRCPVCGEIIGAMDRFCTSCSDKLKEFDENFTIDGADMPTGIAGVENAAAKAVSTTYYTPAGVASKTAVKGLNIVVTKYADGSQKVVKVIK